MDSVNILDPVEDKNTKISRVFGKNLKTGIFSLGICRLSLFSKLPVALFVPSLP
jgi:hypothetical protein